MPTAKMSNAIYDTQAAFDPTICFTVYGSWIEAIEEVETASDRDSLAYQMFKAIANYSMMERSPILTMRLCGHGGVSLRGELIVAWEEDERSLHQRKLPSAKGL